MIRQKLEEYLDGGLDEAERTAIDAQLRADTAAARLLAALQKQRAQRAAVYRTYAPSDAEARAMSAKSSRHLRG